MKLEKKEIARAKNPELGTCRRLPEVDFIDGRQGFQVIEPVMIRDADLKFNRGPSLLIAGLSSALSVRKMIYSK